MLAAAESGTAAGFIQLYPTFSSVSMERRRILNDLFVAPGYQNKGVCRTLLVEGTGAGALYESMGWKQERGHLHYSLKLR